MAIFVTGSTGYLGSYLVAGLLTEYRDNLNLLVRAKSVQEARERLWTSLQLHLNFPQFADFLNARVRMFLGDLTTERFGLADDEYHALVDTTDSMIHCAASLNRKSEKQCMNVNLRGSLEVMQLARRAQNRNGLRRYSHVSTVAVAGKRQNEVVTEDAAIDWSRSDYDPYARTKKFSEHMVHQLLPDVPHTIFRPAIVLGDSRRPETTQFDMVQAFDLFSRLPVLPLRPRDRIDIVPANYVGKAIVTIHQKEEPLHGIYHLSSGEGSQTYEELTDALATQSGGRRPAYWPAFGKPFSGTANWLANRSGAVGYGASLLKVFWPYLDWNTVFDNSRVVAELGEAPAKFATYALPLLKFSRENHFRYPARPWPGDAASEKPLAAGSARA
ncbi:MAG TPA: SDR family oxidoreductase [Candidatus Dormibacteraeota bacterium]|nr:SDR family oxidoreductase [Candidatus Dormibacteraeota bacterium]